jgi:hypothetical protein
VLVGLPLVPGSPGLSSRREESEGDRLPEPSPRPSLDVGRPRPWRLPRPTKFQLRFLARLEGLPKAAGGARKGWFAGH